MRLLFARNELPPEHKACAIEVGAFLLLWLLVLTVSTGPFGEAFARSGLIAVISALLPIRRLSIHWLKRLIFACVIGITVMTVQGFVAYELRQYSPTGDVSNSWLLASLVAYFAISGVAWAAGRYFTGDRLHATGF